MKKIKLVYGAISLLMLMLIAGCNDGGIGAATGVTCPKYDCRLTTTEARFEPEVIDDAGMGCVTDCHADVKVKNIESQPVKARVVARCRTVNKDAQYSSETYWMQPQEEHTFKIKVDAGLTENWRCDDFKVHSEQITACETYEVS